MTDEKRAASLSFRLEGLPEDGGYVRAAEFLAFFRQAMATLKKLERQQGRDPAATYLVSELAVGSAVLEIESMPESIDYESARGVMDSFVAGATALQNGTLGRMGFEPDVERSFHALAAPLRRSLTRIEISTDDGIAIDLTADRFTDAYKPVEGGEIYAAGTLTGFIDAINVHKEPVFYLYPVSGASRVPCVFDRTQLDTARTALKNYCAVNGLLEYQRDHPFPKRIIVENIDVLRSESDRPSLMSYWGIAPDLTGGLDSVTYVRRQRNAQA